jgi:hypothetical protein
MTKIGDRAKFVSKRLKTQPLNLIKRSQTSPIKDWLRKSLSIDIDQLSDPYIKQFFVGNQYLQKYDPTAALECLSQLQHVLDEMQVRKLLANKTSDLNSISLDIKALISLDLNHENRP